MTDSPPAQPSGPEPLWRQVVGDTEPWRRGRILLVIFAVLTTINQIFLFGLMVLNGYVEALLIFGISAGLFWLQFYFVWIGVHWVRWMNALFWGLWAIAISVWGVRDSSGVEIVSGLYAFVVAACLGFVPSIYFFAQRQRETKRWPESVIVAAVLLLLIISLGAGIFGLIGYKNQLKERAYTFANEAFERLFARHDTYFLLEHTSGKAGKTLGYNKWTRFLQDATLRGGDVRDIKPAQGDLRFRYVFPSALGAEGYMTTEGMGPHGHILLYMRINDFEGDWRMDNLAWVYPDSFKSKSR